MKRVIPIVVIFCAVFSLVAQEPLQVRPVNLNQHEIDEISAASGTQYIYFGDDVCSLIADLININKTLVPHKASTTNFDQLMNRIQSGKNAAPCAVVVGALEEVARLIEMGSLTLSDSDRERIALSLDQFYQECQFGSFDVDIVDSCARMSSSCWSFLADYDSLSAKKATAKAVFVKCDVETDSLSVCNNVTIGHDLCVQGDETILGDLTVLGELVFSNTDTIILNGCQPGPITIGIIDPTTSLTFATNGCTPRMIVDAQGDVTINVPDSGTALTINGTTTSAAAEFTGQGSGAPTLILNGNPPSGPTHVFLTIDPITGVVKQSITTLPSNIINNGCQPGPVRFGTSDGTSIIFAPSCVDSLEIDGFGAISINPPVSGPALTVTGNSGASAIIAEGNGTTAAPALTLINIPFASQTDFLLTINNSSGAVDQSGTMLGDVILKGCQPGPIQIGTNDNTSIHFVTSCTDRMIIDGQGDVTVIAPPSGPALTVNGAGTISDPALILNNNPKGDLTEVPLTIDSTDTVKQGTSAPIINGCQPGPLTIGTSDDTSLLLVTSCTDRIEVGGAGTVEINQPSTGPALTVTGNNTTSSPALVLNNNPSSSPTDLFLTIDVNGVVKNGPSIIDFLMSGCQPGPLTLGTSDDTSFNLVTQCTNRIVIAGNGDVSVEQPDSGPAFTVNGDGTLAGPALTLIGNPPSAPTDVVLTINAAGVVREGPSLVDFLMTGCNPGPIIIGTSDATSIHFVTSCTDRMIIDGQGDVTVIAPPSGPALTVNGAGTISDPALVLNNNPKGDPTDFPLTIDSSGTVKQSTSFPIINGCQPGPLTIGTSDDTTLALVTSCTDRIDVGGAGNVEINQPSTGPALTITGNNTTSSPALVLNNNPSSSPTDLFLTIDVNGVVKNGPSIIDFLMTGCQPGPLTIGTSDDTAFHFVTSCTDRMVIEGNGDVRILQPDSGPALTVNGTSDLDAPSLILFGNPSSIITDYLLTIDPTTHIVRQKPFAEGSAVVKNGCQPGPITIGTNDGTSLTFVTSCTDRIVIDGFGVVTVNQSATGPTLTVNGGGTTGSPALVLAGNPTFNTTDVLLTIDSTGTVKEGPSLIDFVLTGCQPGPLTIGTSDDTAFHLVTSCTDRIVIAGNGDVTIEKPDFGPALTVNGDSTTVSPALILNGNPASDPTDVVLTIDQTTGIVKEGPSLVDFLLSGCQPGPLTLGTSDDTSFHFVTSCTDRMVIAGNGDVTIVQPDFGPALTVNGDSTTISPALILNGTPASDQTDVVLTIDANGVVKEGPSLVDFLLSGCHPGPLTLGTSDDTSFHFVTSCTDRMVIAGNGDVTIVQPDFGPALTVNGDSTTVSPALILNGNPLSNPTDVLLTIDQTTGVVKEGPSLVDFLMKDCQPGPLTIGTSDDTEFHLVTSCTDRIIIDGKGDVSVEQPDFGPALTITGQSTLESPALVLINNPPLDLTDYFLTIDNTTGVVKQGQSLLDFILNQCQPGPVTIGTSDQTSLHLVTSCVDRMVIDEFGAVTVNTPDATRAAEALTVTGNIIVPAANTAGTQGRFELGGLNPSSTNINLFEFGTRNFFAGNGTGNTTLTGTDNIALGTSANTGLTTGNNTVALGRTPIATGTDSISIGNGANTTFAGAIVVGSKDSTSTGVAPTVGAANGIAIGSASGTFAGASATGIAAIAIGGSDGASAGTTATGARSVAIGVNAICSLPGNIALGSSSANAVGPRPGTANSLCIGSAFGTKAGPAAVVSQCATTIGSADGIYAGAMGDGKSSVTIGVGASSRAFLNVLIGASSDIFTIACQTGAGAGCGPVSFEANGIGIGSAQGAFRGPNAINQSSIAIGSANAAFIGASTQGFRSIAVGVNARVTGVAGTVGQIALGSASATAAGPLAATAGGSVVIGSAGGSLIAPSTAAPNAVLIGSADGTNAAPILSTTIPARSVVIGIGSTCTVADGFVLGNTTGSAAAKGAVRVGTGTETPAAKLHVVGKILGTPVARFACVNTNIGSQIVISNLASLNPLDPISTLQVAVNGIDNQLMGSAASSRRFKTNIRLVNDESKKIYDLNPIIFDYKPEHNPATDVTGFLAEDVYKVLPSAVALDNEGKPYNIYYDYLHAFAIKEIQLHNKELDNRDVTLDKHRIQLAALSQWFKKLKKR